MGARFEALIEGVLVAVLYSRYTQVGFNLVSVSVCVNNYLENFKHFSGKVLIFLFCVTTFCVRSSIAFSLFIRRTRITLEQRYD